jgi:hypothetical protein
LRRLYRQRNLVLHWGRMNAVGLRAALRTAAPLVGAGMDRIAHDELGVVIQVLGEEAREKARTGDDEDTDRSAHRARGGVMKTVEIASESGSILPHVTDLAHGKRLVASYPLLKDERGRESRSRRTEPVGGRFVRIGCTKDLSPATIGLTLSCESPRFISQKRIAAFQERGRARVGR